MIQWKEECQSLSLTFTVFLASKADVKLIGLCSRRASDGLAEVQTVHRAYLLQHPRDGSKSDVQGGVCGLHFIIINPKTL